MIMKKEIDHVQKFFHGISRKDSDRRYRQSGKAGQRRGIYALRRDDGFKHCHIIQRAEGGHRFLPSQRGVRGEVIRGGKDPRWI